MIETFPDSNEPCLSRLFPIEGEFFAPAVEFNDDLDPVERHAWQTGNLETLPEDHSLRYLLEGRARPDIHPDSRDDYRTGVCLGYAMVRRKMMAMRQEGVDLEERAFDPKVGPVFRYRPSGRLYPFPIGDLKRRQEEASYVYGRVKALTGQDARMTWTGVFGKKAALSSIDFVSSSQLEGTNVETLTLGIGDALELYFGLYGGQKHTIRTSISPSSLRFYRSNAQDDWKRAGIPQREFCDRGVGFLGHEHLTPGYRARVATAAGEVLKATVVWNDLVPANAQVKAVTRSVTYHTMDLTHEVPVADDVGDNTSSKDFRLGRYDELVVVGKAENFLRLRHPFVISPEMLISEAEPYVQILSLFTLGREVSLSDEAEEIVPAELRATIIKEQKEYTPAWAKLARLIARNNHLADVGLTWNVYYGAEGLVNLASLPGKPLGIMACGLYWFWEKYRRQYKYTI